MTYVHDIWNKYALKKEFYGCGYVTHFRVISIRCLNTKIRFTANDLVPLDWTLLHTMVAAVATYVIILIQFKI
jgi:hypothetical protein